MELGHLISSSIFFFLSSFILGALYVDGAASRGGSSGYVENEKRPRNDSPAIQM